MSYYGYKRQEQGRIVSKQMVIFVWRAWYAGAYPFFYFYQHLIKPEYAQVTAKILGIYAGAFAQYKSNAYFYLL